MFFGFRERGREGERGKEREIEKSMWERNINQLSHVCAPTGDGTCNLGTCPARDRTLNLLVYGTMLQSTEPPGQGSNIFLNAANGFSLCHYCPFSRLRLSILFWKTTQVFVLTFQNFSPDPPSQLLISNSFNWHILSWPHLLIALALIWCLPVSKSCPKLHPLLMHPLCLSLLSLHLPFHFLKSLFLRRKFSSRAVLASTPFQHLCLVLAKLVLLWQTIKMSLLLVCLLRLCPVACTFLLPTPLWTVP